MKPLRSIPAYVINLDRRPDRWGHAMVQIATHKLSPQRFEGYDSPLYSGIPNGNMGCTASHRALLELISWSGAEWTLVLEDDFMSRYDNPCEMFDAISGEIPSDADLVYLGGHYQESPIARVSEHVVRCAGMLTTSSYLITAKHARRMAPYISGIGPIDNLYSGFARSNRHYIIQPRLFVQYTSPSDLCGETKNNEPCMTDTRHEQMV